MKVVCVNADYCINITLYKTYDAEISYTGGIIYSDYWRVCNDVEYRGVYPKSRFIPLKEYRKMKIKKLNESEIIEGI
jgi:hypothetical protein